MLKRILFVCGENAGRSQIAEAFAKKYWKDRFIVSSAGNKPADRVNPVVVEALKEKGIDISMNEPKLLTFQMAQDAVLLSPWAAVTMESAPDHSSNQQLNGNLKIRRESQSRN